MSDTTKARRMAAEATDMGYRAMSTIKGLEAALKAESATVAFLKNMKPRWLWRAMIWYNHWRHDHAKTNLHNLPR